MYDNDYIVLIDENGQPYIAHGWRDWARSAPAAAKNAARTAGRKATKYIEKIVDKGKARYFYTQDELKAYYDNLRNTASSTARNAASRVRTAATNTRNAVNRTAHNAKEKARDVLGYDEFDRYERAWDRTAAAKQRAEANPNSAYAQAEKDRAEAAEARAHEEYLRTPLGRARDAASRVQEMLSEFGDTTLDSIDDFLKNTGEKVKNVAALAAKAGVTVAAVPAAAVTMLATGAAIAPIIATKYAAYKLNELWNYELSWRVNNAARTIENAARGVSNAVNSAKETVTNTVDTVKEKATGVINSAKERKEIADTSSWIKKNAKTKGISEEESYNQLVNWLDGMIANSSDPEHRAYYEREKEYAERAFR